MLHIAYPPIFVNLYLGFTGAFSVNVFGESSLTCLVPALSGLNVSFLLTMLLPPALLGIVTLCVKFGFQRKVQVGMSLRSSGLEGTVKSIASDKLVLEDDSGTDTN